MPRLDEMMNLRLKELRQNQNNLRDEHETINDIDDVLTEFGLWLQERKFICYIAFDDFDIWS